MTFFSPEPGQWVAPLPDLSKPAAKRRMRIGERVFDVLVSAVQHEVPREPNTHLIHLGVFLDGQPLTAFDLGLNTPDAGSEAWAYLTNRLNETAVQFYTPQPRETGELNPRLGCWGPRPDLVPLGLGDSDCAIAVVLGLSIWLPGARPPVDEGVFLESLRDTLAEAVTYWAVLAQRSGAAGERRS
jgi:hypothetical protein